MVLPGWTVICQDKVSLRVTSLPFDVKARKRFFYWFVAWGSHPSTLNQVRIGRRPSSEGGSSNQGRCRWRRSFHTDRLTDKFPFCSDKYKYKKAKFGKGIDLERGVDSEFFYSFSHGAIRKRDPMRDAPGPRALALKRMVFGCIRFMLGFQVFPDLETFPADGTWQIWKTFCFVYNRPFWACIKEKKNV